jgi:hypothetical protein
MNIFKLVLRSSLTFVFFGVLRAALFIYILFLPDSPLVGVGPTAMSAQACRLQCHGGGRRHANVA